MAAAAAAAAGFWEEGASAVLPSGGNHSVTALLPDIPLRTRAENHVMIKPATVSESHDPCAQKAIYINVGGCG